MKTAKQMLSVQQAVVVVPAFRVKRGRGQRKNRRPKA